MKKHCIVITRFVKDQPGFLDFAYRIKTLAEHYRVTVVSNMPLTQTELQIDAVEYIVLKGGESRAGWLRYAWNCTGLLRARRPAVAVLLHSAVAPVALLTGRIPTALYWNEHPSHLVEVPQHFAPVKGAIRSILRWLVFQGARNATVVMPIGEAHLDDLLERGFARERMRMIYMGVDGSFARTPPTSERTQQDLPLQLVYVGSVSKERGCDVMLEGLAQANKKGDIARLTIIGANREQIEYCTRYAMQLGINERMISVQGRMPGYDIPAVLAMADAGICIAENKLWWRFNPPTKLFEYLAAGLPVLASDVRTHTQYVSDWDNGMVFNFDSRSFAQAVSLLWQRRSELSLLKQRAQQSGEQYMWKKIEPVFLRAVQDIAHS